MNTDKTKPDKENDIKKFKDLISNSENQKKIKKFIEDNAPENTNKFKNALEEFEKDKNKKNIENIAKLFVDIQAGLDKDEQNIIGGKKHKTRKYKKKDKKKTMKKKGKKKTMKKRGKKSRK